jgi:hypothetical protein
MIDENRSIEISDHGYAVDDARVVRYKGTQQMVDLINRGEYIEASVHAQLAIEKVLWDKIVQLFQGARAMLVRRTIEESKSLTSTRELIKWAHFLGAINDSEHGDLLRFNAARNKIFHGHGQWWDAKQYREALEKGIGFLKENGF